MSNPRGPSTFMTWVDGNEIVVSLEDITEVRQKFLVSDQVGVLIIPKLVYLKAISMDRLFLFNEHHFFDLKLSTHIQSVIIDAT